LALDFIQSDGTQRKLTYAALELASDALTARLASIFSSNPSIPTERIIIPVLIPQCADLYITLLAILKLGTAFCPLNLDAPGERIQFVANDVSAKVLITTMACKSLVPDISGLIIVVVDEALDSTIVRPTCIVRQISSKDLAYVMYSKSFTLQLEQILPRSHDYSSIRLHRPAQRRWHFSSSGHSIFTSA